MFARHDLTCQREGCGARFTARRSDAKWCSKSCRQRHDSPAPEPVQPAPGRVSDDEIAEMIAEGWRRVPGGWAPPHDPRNIFHVDGFQ